MSLLLSLLGLHEKPKFPDGLLLGRLGFKCLGVFLGDKANIMRNWEGGLEKVKGRLAKLNWLIPNLSHRGQVLIVNNLVVSSLWHKLACLDPLQVS